MTDTKQFNVRIPKALADRVKLDAMKAGQTRDAIVATIFEEFLAAPAKDRVAIYARSEIKLRKNRRMRQVEVGA